MILRRYYSLLAVELGAVVHRVATQPRQGRVCGLDTSQGVEHVEYDHYKHRVSAKLPLNGIPQVAGRACTRA